MLHKAVFALIGILLLPAGAWIFRVDRNVRVVPINVEKIEELDDKCVTKADVEGLSTLTLQAALLEQDLKNLHVSITDLQIMVRDILLRRQIDEPREQP